MVRRITYAKAGVDRKIRARSKKALHLLKETYKFSHYGAVLGIPFGNIFPIGSKRYLDLQIEGVGTKVLVAQLARKYDTIGIDGVAMAVNDVIRSGASPLAIADNIHTQTSDPALIRELLKGVTKGATEAQCLVPSGEIGDVSELIKGLVEGKGFDMIVAAIGEVTQEKIVTGRKIKTGDVIVGLRSSGLHSNGISLARRILFKHWGGKYQPHDAPDGLTRPIVEEVLEPTKIYVKPMLRTANEVEIKGAVHITGDAYLKFNNLTKFSTGIGFEFNNFDPHPVFAAIQSTALKLGCAIADEEMFRTFNMGWGFAIVVDEASKDMAIEILEKNDSQAEQIGRITGSPGIRIAYGKRKIILK